MVIVLLKGVDFIDKRKTRVASGFSVRASERVSERASERAREQRSLENTRQGSEGTTPIPSAG